MRKKSLVLCSAISLIAAVALADTPPNRPPTVANPRAVGSVHIVSVQVQGGCGDQARFVVTVQNNLNRVAHLGTVFVGSANSPGNRPTNPHADFRNLAPGARQTLTLTSSWRLYCTNPEEGGAQCFEIGIAMEPDGTANGEIWDGVWHRVCGQLPKGGQKSGPVLFNDTTFRR